MNVTLNYVHNPDSLKLQSVLQTHFCNGKVLNHIKTYTKQLSSINF